MSPGLQDGFQLKDRDRQLL